MIDDRPATLAALIAAAVTKYDFAEPVPMPPSRDALTAWLRKLVAHVESRDWADAYELMIGKRQADWSPDDVRAFSKRRLSGPGPKLAFAPGEAVVIAGIIESPLTSETTPEALLALARHGLDWFVTERVKAPTKELPIFASVLLTDGRSLTTECGSDNRIAVLKLLTQQLPVYGFWLVFDAFMHQIDERVGRATKRDALLCQVGTREQRWMLRRPYDIRDGVARFDDPLPDVDVTHPDRDAEYRDPYAELFVSVPPSMGAPS